MREIKFRGWDWFDKRMVFWTLNDLLVRFDADEKYGLDDSPSALYEWMQYTGLKDKNGKEIYEGDVIEWEGEEGSWGMAITKVRREVKFKDGAFLTHTEFTTNENYLPIVGVWGEVIGNIYENPELLQAITD